MPSWSRPAPSWYLSAVAVLLDEAVGLERLEQAVDGRRGEAEALRELGDAEPPRAAGEDLEDPRGAVDRLDRAALGELARWSRCLFGIVE